MNAKSQDKVYLNVPLSSQAPILSWDAEHRQRIVQGALRVLAEVGLRIEGSDNLRMVERAGGNVVWEDGTVRLKPEQVRSVAAKLAADSPHEPQQRRMAEGPPQSFGVGNGGSLYFDWDRWQARGATREDLRDLALWAEGSPKVATSHQYCLVQEQGLNPVLQIADSFAIMFQHSTKPVYFDQPKYPIHVRYLKRLQELQRARGYHQDIPRFEWVNPPLTLSSRALAAVLERVDQGVDPVGMGCMTMAGMAAPITGAGFAVMATAELLAGLSVLHLLRPQAQLSAAMLGGLVDMKNGRISYQTPWMAAAHYLVVDVFRSEFGAQLSYNRAYRDANEPGMQACYEWALLNMFHGCLDGTFGSEVGGLANGNLFSPEQAVIDMEMAADASQFFTGFACEDEDAAVEVILEARHKSKAYMEHPHTLNHFRESLAYSDWWLRGLPAAARHDPASSQSERLLAQAHEAALSARKAGEQRLADQGPAHQDLAKQCWRVVAEMAKEIGCPAPRPLGR